MGDINYTITKLNSKPPPVLIDKIKNIDRTEFWVYEDKEAIIDLEFKPSKIGEIRIGIMTDVKISIKAWNKFMNDKKNLINKKETTTNMIKALVYQSKTFQHVKNM
jgi:hypothetical protein